MPASKPASSLGAKSLLVSAGMLLSRVAGLARQWIFTKYFGLTPEADAFGAALRIPNFLQNLFGDGVLSASLIPVYSRLVAQRGQEEADRVARTVLALLALVISLIVLAGVLFTPFFVDLVAYGFKDGKRELTITLVRIIFPGVGLLVGSAWCLAILNTHGKFFNSYAAPALWNAAIIVALVWFRHDKLPALAIVAAWGAVAGSVLQLLTQLPQVIAVMSSGWSQISLRRTAEVSEVIASSIPVILSRGAIQVSAFVDGLIASGLGDGPVAALGNAQSLYMFPVSIFGMAISSAALPAMSAVRHHEDTSVIAKHLIDGQKILLALMVPSVVGFLAFGDIMTGLLFEHGLFTHKNTQFVWAILAGSAVGLIATTVARFYTSAFYALGDSKTPARFAFVRITLVVLLGVLMARGIPYVFHLDLMWGTPGLTLSAGIAGWIEFSLLRSALKKRIADFAVPVSFLMKCWAVALVAAALTTGLRWVVPERVIWARNLAILVGFGLVYLAGAAVVGVLPVADIRRKLRI
jgi:putative peptidoglycan lipid II flippase